MNCLTTILAVAVLAAICGCSDNGPNAGSSLDPHPAAALAPTNPETLADNLIGLSADQHTAGDVAGAAESLSAAARAVSEVANAGAQAKLFVRISDEQLRQGNAKAAMTTLAKADSAARQAHHPAVRANALAQIGSLYARPHKQIAPAIAAVEEAQKAAGSIDDPQLRVEVYCTIAKAYATLNKPADANRMLSFAATTAKAIDNPKRQSQSLAVVAAAHIEMQNELAKR